MAIVMNRVTNKSKRVLRFEDLNCGDIFMSDQDDWYMKIYNTYDECGDLEGNAIRLDNGQISIFDDTETVKKLKIKDSIAYKASI